MTDQVQAQAFEYKDIGILVDKLKSHLALEFMAANDAQGVRSHAEAVQSRIQGAAVAAGEIDGKNAEIRKAQLAAVLTGSEEYQAARAAAEVQEQQATLRGLERRSAEALVSLTKAWLYSQAKIG